MTGGSSSQVRRCTLDAVTVGSNPTPPANHLCLVYEEIVPGRYARCVECEDIIESLEIHFREDKRMKAFYLRDEQRRPVALVGTERIDTDEFPDIQAVHFAVATWNPADIYDKSIARGIVKGRLGTGRSIPMRLDEHIKHAIISYIAYGHEPGRQVVYPTRTRKAALLWLKNNVVSS